MPLPYSFTLGDRTKDEAETNVTVYEDAIVFERMEGDRDCEPLKITADQWAKMLIWGDESRVYVQAELVRWIFTDSEDIPK